MKTENLLVCAALLALLIAAPAAAQSDGDSGWKPWKLDIKTMPLDVRVVNYRDGSARTFYAMPFTITNNGDTEAPLGIHMVAHVGTNPKKRKTHIALPHRDAEELYRRLSNNTEIKNVQEINAMTTLAPGKSVLGVAVFGTFDREWDKTTIVVTGLEPRAIPTRIRDYGNNGFTLPHRAYHAHNEKVTKSAGKDAEYTDRNVVLQHNVALELTFGRKGDEFAPQLDPIIPLGTNWTVLEPKVVRELKTYSAASK